MLFCVGNWLLVGGNNFFGGGGVGRWGEDEQIFGWWGGFPPSPSNENPGIMEFCV